MALARLELGGHDITDLWPQSCRTRAAVLHPAARVEIPADRDTVCGVARRPSARGSVSVDERRLTVADFVRRLGRFRDDGMSQPWEL
jgi:hypothetical protein